MSFKNEHPDHRIETHDGWNAPSYARCGCGWREECQTRHGAEAAAARHYVETTRETAVPIGQFVARCRLKRPVPIDQAPEQLQPLIDADVTTPGRIKSRWDKKLGNVVDLPCGVTTTDPKAFEKHMRELHSDQRRGGERVYGPLTGVNLAFSRRVRTKWKSPKAPAEYKGVKFSAKAIAETVRTCEACGLVAEVDGRAGNERWWAEHEQQCTGAETAVA